jgi:hypothetical protein
MHADTIHTDILRAGISIAHTIHGHKLTVSIAVTIIHGAGIAIIAFNGIVMAIAKSVAPIGCTGVSIVTIEGCIYTLTIDTFVQRAGITVIAHDRCEYTLTIDAFVCGAGIKVIADDRIVVTIT